MIDALILHHSKRGVYYPKGGASEITYRIIQVVEKHGGKVLMKAPVSSIQLRVTLKTNGGEVEIQVPVIVSNARMFNTFRKLLPPEVQALPVGDVACSQCQHAWTWSHKWIYLCYFADISLRTCAYITVY